MNRGRLERLGEDGGGERAGTEKLAAVEAGGVMYALPFAPYRTASAAGRLPVSTQPFSASHVAVICSGEKPQWV